MFNDAHLGMDLLEDPSSLLQTKQNILLYLGELDLGRQPLQLLQLRVRLGQERLLILFAPQGEERSFLVALGEHLPRNIRLLVRQNGDAPLVLMELVALVLHVQDRPGSPARPSQQR